MENQTKTYTQNDDGTYTKVTTTTYSATDNDVLTQVISADQYQAEQDAIQAQIDSLNAQLDSLQTVHDNMTQLKTQVKPETEQLTNNQ